MVTPSDDEIEKSMQIDTDKLAQKLADGQSVTETEEKLLKTVDGMTKHENVRHGEEEPSS